MWWQLFIASQSCPLPLNLGLIVGQVFGLVKKKKNQGIYSVQVIEVCHSLIT
jgi:hypothetical protein